MSWKQNFIETLSFFSFQDHTWSYFCTFELISTGKIPSKSKILNLVIMWHQWLKDKKCKLEKNNNRQRIPLKIKDTYFSSFNIVFRVHSRQESSLLWLEPNILTLLFKIIKLLITLYKVISTPRCVIVSNDVTYWTYSVVVILLPC